MRMLRVRPGRRDRSGSASLPGAPTRYELDLHAVISQVGNTDPPPTASIEHALRATRRSRSGTG
jgi:hypothetical protein